MNTRIIFTENEEILELDIESKKYYNSSVCKKIKNSTPVRDHSELLSLMCSNNKVTYKVKSSKEFIFLRKNRIPVVLWGK